MNKQKFPEQMSLRGESPLREPIHIPASGEQESPRALRALARIVDGGLCHRCGSCVGICPTSTLGFDEYDYPMIKSLSSCTDCDLCVRVCPGDEFNFFATYKEFHGVEADITSTHGHFKEAAVGYSNDPAIRQNSTSGGIISALLIYLLESKKIDGAIVVASDPNTLWKGRPIIARSKQEILSAMKSKYAICPTNSMISELRDLPGKYAAVGLPCQIHGLHKAMALDPRLKSKIIFRIGLFCHAAIEHEAFETIWETLGPKTVGAKRFISRIGKHPGAPNLELADGSLYPVYFGDRTGYRPTSIEVINVLYRLFTPNRCMTCFDALSEFADVSVGDPWLAPPEKSVDWYDGWSFALMRTDQGREIYLEAAKAGYLTSLAVTRNEALASNSMMATEKRWRALRMIETHKRQGKPVPRYGTPEQDMAKRGSWHFPHHGGLQFVKTEIHILSHIFCFLPQYRRSVLRFLLGRGYWLFWLNHKRRALRVWIRDTLFGIRRDMFGRR